MTESDLFFDHLPDESEHFFLRFLHKKLRSINKKLREAEQLEVSAQPLKPEQKKKLLNKAKLIEEKLQYDTMTNAFFQAEKEFPQMVTPKKVEHIEPLKRDLESTIKPVFDLIYLSQLWLQCNYSNNLPGLKSNQELMQDLSVLSEFYHKIFFIPQGVEYLSMEDKALRCKELEKFIEKAREEVAVKSCNYASLNAIVNKYDNLENFLKKKEEGNVSVIATEETKSMSSKEENLPLVVQEKEIAPITQEVNLAKPEKIENEEKTIEIKNVEEKKNVEEIKEVPQERKMVRENKRNYQADASRKYQLNGDKKKFNSYNKKGYENGKKMMKTEYVVEYVKKDV